MYMALISTDEVCIWLYGNLQYSVTENFITRIPQYIIIFTCGNLSQIIIENETVFAVYFCSLKFILTSLNINY